MTNTAHHQAIISVGPVLRISGKAKDCITEIIESVNSAFFCIGVQSHPEAEEDGDLELIFKAFAESL